MENKGTEYEGYSINEMEAFLMEKMLSAEDAHDLKLYNDALVNLRNSRIAEEQGAERIETEKSISQERLESEQAFNREKLEKELELQMKQMENDNENAEKDRKSKHTVLQILTGAGATVAAGVFDGSWLGKVEQIEKTENIALNTRKYTRPK